MRQGGPCSIWSATWTVGDADGNKKTRISGDCSKSTGRAEEGTHRKQKRRKKTPNQLPAWNARKLGGRFCLNCKRLTALLFASGNPGGCPTASRRRTYFFLAGGLKSVAFDRFSFRTVAGFETRMANNFAREFNFNVHMDEDRFVVAICCCPLCSILCIHAAKDTHPS